MSILHKRVTYKQVIFDLDGTLVDSTTVILRAFETAHKQLDLPYPGDKIMKTYFGNSLINIIENLEIPAKKRAQFIQIFTEAELQSEKFVLFNGMKLVIEQIKSLDHKLVIVTSKRRKTAKHSLSLVNLLNDTDLLITADDVKFAKPHPEPLLKACRMLSLSPDKSVVYIGDTEKDVTAARQAGISVIYVCWGVGGKRSDLDADIIVHTPRELLKRITQEE